MKLLSKELEAKFEKYPLYSQDGKLGDAKVIAKFFNPTGAGTWLITEAEKQYNGDYLMFGYCCLGDLEMAELGDVILSDLQNLKLPYGFTIERDLHYPEEITLRDACKREFGIVPSLFAEKTKFAIFQLKDGEENHYLRFASISELKNIDDINANNYVEVYEGIRDSVDMSDGGEIYYACEGLFCAFNRELPDDFKGHSLSVSDVILLECEGVTKAYYCDKIGFKEIPTFVEQLEYYPNINNDKDITDEM